MCLLVWLVLKVKQCPHKQVILYWAAQRAYPEIARQLHHVAIPRIHKLQPENLSLLSP